MCKGLIWRCLCKIATSIAFQNTMDDTLFLRLSVLMKANDGVDVLFLKKLRLFKHNWELFLEVTSTIGVVFNNDHGEHGSSTQLHHKSSIEGNFRASRNALQPHIQTIF